MPGIIQGCNFQRDQTITDHLRRLSVVINSHWHVGKDARLDGILMPITHETKTSPRYTVGASVQETISLTQTDTPRVKLHQLEKRFLHLSIGPNYSE
ncbi:hypothetical protein J6590_095760 [Homalodisca vitripennis]|nr:hypothetical protein J6590_095760 [Homalodisca vitripennis]